MFKLLGCEFKKLHNSKLLLAGCAIIILICAGVSVIEFRNVSFGASHTFYIDFMLYNTSFVITNFFIPAIMILLTASVWGGEYAGGMIKTFMLCRCKKSEFYVSKVLFLVICGIFAVVAAFLALSGLFLLHNGMEGITVREVLDMAKVYVYIIIGLLPVILLTVVASMFFDDFQKSFSCGLVLLLLSLSADNISAASFLLPTYFLNHSSLVYYMQEKAESFFALAVYIVVLYVAGTIIFVKKDIWS